MDNELDQLEAELKRLEPSSVSKETLARIETTLSRPPEIKPVAELRWFWAATLAAAAVVAFVFVQNSRRRAEPRNENTAVVDATPKAGATAPLADSAVFKPVADESVLVSARDEGLVTLDDGTRARRERLQFVETITWKNPRTNASLIWSMPREEVRVVPISFQ